MIGKDAEREKIRQVEAILGTTTEEEQRLLAQRLQTADSRADWVRWLVLTGSVATIAILLWAAMMLNKAWVRSEEAEAVQRSLAQRLNAS